jgi:hypothetical protein
MLSCKVKLEEERRLPRFDCWKNNISNLQALTEYFHQIPDLLAVLGKSHQSYCHLLSHEKMKAVYCM